MSGTWLAVADGSPFCIDNLPYGIFSGAGRKRRIDAVRGYESRWSGKRAKR